MRRNASTTGKSWALVPGAITQVWFGRSDRSEEHSAAGQWLVHDGILVLTAPMLSSFISSWEC